MRAIGVLLGLGLLGAAAVAPAAGGQIDAGATAFLQTVSLPPPAANRVIFCHGFGCAFRTEIGLGPGDRAQMASLMAAGAGSAAAERAAIARTEVWFEKRVAPLTGTGKAKARAGGLGHANDRTQFDCIDATVNTTSLLIVLQELGLMRHHRVGEPISRLLTGGGPHYTAVITETKTGAEYTVDPWTHDRGELPDVWPVGRWKAGG
jgi:hypothetical protein